MTAQYKMTCQDCASHSSFFSGTCYRIVNQTLCLDPSKAWLTQTYRHSKEVGFVHHVQDHLAHLSVIHREVVVHVVPLLVSEELHDTGEGLRNHPDAIVGKAVKLAGLHSFLLSLPVVLPRVVLRRLNTHR